MEPILVGDLIETGYRTSAMDGFRVLAVAYKHVGAQKRRLFQGGRVKT